MIPDSGSGIDNCPDWLTMSNESVGEPVERGKSERTENTVPALVPLRRDINLPERDPSDDTLGPARGIIIGSLLSVGIWMILGFVWYLL
jgi:hypothetical protein